MIWTWVIQLIIAIVFFVVGELLRPKPEFEDATATPFGEVNLPQTNPARKQAIIWGKVDIRSPHVMDVTEYNPIPIVKKIKTSMFSSKKVTIGHRYFMGMQLGICARVTTLHKIWLDDRELWAGTFGQLDNGVAGTIDLPDFFGGREEGGGVEGDFRFFGGSATQKQSSYLAGFQTPSPAYRWTSYVQLENMELGESPRIQNIAFQVSRYPDPLALGGDNNIGVDINPMTILYELLVDEDFGFGMDPGDVNTAELVAVAAVLKTEANGMSLKWTQNQTLDKLIMNVNRQIDGILRFDPSTGQWGYKIMRNDYSIPALKTFDATNILSLTNYSRSNWDETINQIEAKYVQLDSVESPSPAMAEDRSNFVRQGRQKIQTLVFPGCYNSTTANLLASRELFTMGVPIASVDFICNREAYDLLPGDPFVFAWPELGISQIIMRVADLGYGDDEIQTMQVGAVEDVFATRDALFADPPPTLFTSPGGAPIDIPAANQFAMDMPYIFDLNNPDVVSPGTNHIPVTMAVKPQGNALFYQIYQRLNASGDAFVPENQADYLPSGTITGLAENAGGENDTLTTLVVNSVSNVPLLDETLQDEANIKKQLWNLVLLVPTTGEPEFMAYESLTIVGSTVTMNTVHRGLFDTLPVESVSGDRIYFLTGPETPGPGKTESLFGAADVVDIQLENVNPEGAATIGTTLVVTMRDRVNRPYPGRHLEINDIRYPVSSFAASIDLEISWRHSDRTAIPFIYHDELGSAGPADLETGFEYRLQIYDDIGSTLLRTQDGDTGSNNFTTFTQTEVMYDYTTALQITDGGPFARYRVELRVLDNVATPTIWNIVDVIRIFNVVIPVSFLRRGPSYWSTVKANTTGLHYPLQELAAPFVDSSSEGAGNATINGTLAGVGGPGPNPLALGVALPGDNLGAGWQADVDIPDDNNWDTGGGVGPAWTFQFMFRVVADAQTNNRILMIKDDGVIALAPAWTIGIDSSGYIIIKHTSLVRVSRIATGQNLEDGKWHHLYWGRGETTNGGEAICLIDGAMVEKSTSNNVGSSNTLPVTLGGYSGAGTDTLGWAKAHFAEVSADNVYWNVPNLVAMAVDSMEPTPFQSLCQGMLTTLWLRGSVTSDSGGAGPLDMSENMVSNDVDFSWAPSSPGGSAVGGERGVMFDGLTLSLWDTGPLADGSLSYSYNHNTRYIQVFGRWPWDGASANTQGPQETGFFFQIKPDNLTNDIMLYAMIDADFGPGADRGEVYSFFVNSDGRIHIHMETEANNYRQQRTTDVAIVTTVWNWIHIVNRVTTGWAVFVNGIEFALDTAHATNGANVPAVDVFLNDRRPSFSLDDIMFQNSFLAFRGGDTILNFTTAADWAGRTSEIGIIRDATWTDDDVVIHYCAGLASFATMKDVVMDFNPENVFQVLASTAADLRGNIITPTANGTFATDEEVPLGQDDETKPQRFDASASNRLDYTSDFLLSSKGTGVFDGFTIVTIAQLLLTGQNHVIWSNFEVGLSDNQRIVWNDSGDTLEFGSTGQSNIVGPVYPLGRPFCSVMTHEDAAGDKWNWWNEGKRAVAETTTARLYTGSAIDRFKIGANAANSTHMEGNPHYISAYARKVSDRLARRITLKFRGFKGSMLEIHSHIDDAESVNGFIYPMSDRDMSNVCENWVINDTNIQNMALTGTHTQLKESVTHGIPRAAQFASASYVTSTFLGAGTYPFTFGGWCRVDGGTDAVFSISDENHALRYVAVGILNGRAGIKIAVEATEVEERGTTVIAVGDWAFVQIVLISDVSRLLYLNGQLEATFTTSRNVNGTVLANANILAVNRIEGAGSDFTGSYQLFHGLDKTLDAEDLRLIHREATHFSWRALTVGDLATASWLLDEPTDMVTGIYRDQFNDDYSAAPTSSGVTQGVAGLLPASLGNCVELDGVNGGIDTGYLGYEAGSDNRAFECWLGAGYTGTVVAMGAAVDAQAVVISVDGSGDLSIHIRGSGNERIWTTALDAGTEHHLFVQLNGDSLFDFQVFINGIEETTIGTAGTDTVLATTATINLHIGEDTTGVAKADGAGKIYGVTVYDITNVPFADGQIALKNNAGRARLGGLS